MERVFIHSKILSSNTKDIGKTVSNMVGFLYLNTLGYGIMIMKDGTYYEGEFYEGEMNGNGERRYNDGSIYKGEFRQGEKDGYGEIQYTKTGEWYKGAWCLNVRHGQGTLFTKDRTTFTVIIHWLIVFLGRIQRSLAKWNVHDIIQ